MKTTDWRVLQTRTFIRILIQECSTLKIYIKYSVKRRKTMCKRSSINWMRTVLLSESRIDIAADCMQCVHEKNEMVFCLRCTFYKSKKISQ